VQPRVSVVVPAYNNEDFVAQTLDSILVQDYDDYELVVADHSSRDGTQAVLERYRGLPRVRILEPTPAGGGALANWNRVSAEARGELVKLVCGDDLIAPTALREQVAAMDAHPSAVLVASPRNLIDAQGRVVVRGRGLAGLRGLVSGREAVRRSVRAGTNIFGEPGCVLFRRELLEREGGWDNSFPYLIDQATYTRIMLHGDMVALPHTLASFRISATQWSVRLMKEQAAQAVAFHEHLRRTVPGLLSALDLRVGNAMARAMALARRSAYLWLRRRM
jgi:Glycosyltransferases, probably involved in cell wall biogenesis